MDWIDVEEYQPHESETVLCIARIIGSFTSERVIKLFCWVDDHWVDPTGLNRHSYEIEKCCKIEIPKEYEDCRFIIRED